MASAISVGVYKRGHVIRRARPALACLAARVRDSLGGRRFRRSTSATRHAVALVLGELEARNAVIEGVQIVPLGRISDARGSVFHMLKATDPHFVRFGEIYFSSVYPGVIKAWKRHQRVTANYACIFGRVKVAIYDERADSATRGAVMEVYLSPDEYSLAVIPPGLWHGFQGVSHPAAILANCATEPNDPSELDRLDPKQNHIPYDWR